VGTGRTAAELAKAFPQVPVVSSDSDVGIRRTVESKPMLVVATPGAEPAVPGRYAAGLLLDGDVMLAAPRLRAPQDALAKWAHAATLVDPAGQVLLVADPGAPAVQAMVRADPIGWAERELAQRAAAGVPPAVRFITLAGPPDDVTELARAASERLGRDLIVLGPVPGNDGPRWLLAVDYVESASVTAALGEAQRVRSKARKSVVSIRVDPDDLG
jgi:primosomal protein N' (replication factor Y)